MKQWHLTGDQYEVIKKDFEKIRKANNMRRKGKFPRFVWYGDQEKLSCSYDRNYDPRTGKDELKSATISWEGEDITHFYVDIKKLLGKYL